MAQIQVEKSIHIDAPVGHIFRYVDTPENFRNFCPNIVEIKDVEQVSRERKRFVWTMKLMDVRFLGICRYMEYKFGQRIVCEISEGIIGRLIWLFESTADGTLTTFKVEYKVPRPLLKKHNAEQVTRQNERDAQKILDRLKAIIETNKEAAA
jgi:uncharacterized membrane protein